ncbi:MAG: zinc-binding dehydrogenase [Phycisphaerales bacterium]|nr:zinc-binding dehydrogenase [Phycisphaerales bacterium]
MRGLAITKDGAPVAPNVALLDSIPDPTAGPGEVLVRTEASGLNHLDLWVGMGMPGIDRPYPRITGSDGVGVIEAVGEGVSEDDWLGQRVILNAAIAMPQEGQLGRPPAGEKFHVIGEQLPGAMAEQFIAPVANVLPIGGADPIAAAAFGLVHLTAWRMLITRAGLQPGQSILITGIGGGVSLAALGIARYLGCPAIVTSRSEAKLELAEGLGACHGILDDGTDFSREVRTLTGGRGVDVCADSVGKAVHLRCIKSLARGGAFVTCGATSGPAGETDLTRIFWNQLRILGSTMGDMDEFRAVVALFLSGALSPVIDHVYPVEQAQEGFLRLEAGEQFGKIVVDWRP